MCRRLLRAGLVPETPPPHSTQHASGNFPDGAKPTPEASPDRGEPRLEKPILAPIELNTQKGGLSGEGLPSWLRQHCLNLVASECSRDPTMMLMMYHWLRLVPPEDEELECLPRSLMEPGSCLSRVLSLLRAEGYLQRGSDGKMSDDAEIDAGARDDRRLESEEHGGIGADSSPCDSDVEIKDIGQGNEENSKTSEAMRGPSVDERNVVESDVRRTPLSDLIDEQARFLSRKAGEPVESWVSNRPWYALASALAAGRPLQILSARLWPPDADVSRDEEPTDVMLPIQTRLSESNVEANNCDVNQERIVSVEGSVADVSQTADTSLSFCSRLESSSKDREVSFGGLDQSRSHSGSAQEARVFWEKSTECSALDVMDFKNDPLNLLRRSSEESSSFFSQKRVDFEHNSGHFLRRSSQQSAQKSSLDCQYEHDQYLSSSFDVGRSSIMVSSSSLPKESTPDPKAPRVPFKPRMPENHHKGSPGAESDGHSRPPDREELWPELKRVLRPGSACPEVPALATLLDGRAPSRLIRLVQKLQAKYVLPVCCFSNCLD